MKERKDCKYRMLDGMPVVIHGDKVWCFADTTHDWMEIFPGDKDYDWNLVYLRGPWKYTFADLPEPPISAAKPKRARRSAKRCDTRAKAAMGILRPGEAPLGNLTSEEQKWLLTTFAHLNRIYEKREMGEPGAQAFCIFEVGNVYVQFLASWDAEQLLCEAVSAKSVPGIATVLKPESEEALRRLGFEPPEISPNYSQTIKIEETADLGYAARLACRVLKEVYCVTDFSSVTAEAHIPVRAE